MMAEKPLVPPDRRLYGTASQGEYECASEHGQGYVILSGARKYGTRQIHFSWRKPGDFFPMTRCPVSFVPTK
jgi:hypothetical protein